MLLLKRLSTGCLNRNLSAEFQKGSLEFYSHALSWARLSFLLVLGCFSALSAVRFQVSGVRRCLIASFSDLPKRPMRFLVQEPLVTDCECFQKVSAKIIFLTSGWVRLPAEFKHIIERRK
jgi:hypothetical protein